MAKWMGSYGDMLEAVSLLRKTMRGEVVSGAETNHSPTLDQRLLAAKYLAKLAISGDVSEEAKNGRT